MEKTRTEKAEALPAQLYQRLKPLIELLTKLKEVGIEQYIKLPRIAVVGEQSAGKSSVLESIVGEDFLPKSDELCTRRPLNLRLMNTDSNSVSIRIKTSNTAEWEKVASFPELTTKIIELTNEKAGNKGNIIDDPIFVEIEKMDCPEITLIDLPGIAKNPLANSEQPENIEEITKKLIETYIVEKQTIILCVVAANVDAAASDSIKMARKFDPDGVRTIGVCTKVDIMDKGTNVKKMLENKYVALNLGWVAVKNRSKKQVEDGMKIMDARTEENQYFQTHEVYSKMQKSLFGVENLSKKLMNIMQNRIEEEIPHIQKQISERLSAAADSLAELGVAPPSTANEISRFIGDLLNNFNEEFRDRMEGEKVEDGGKSYYGPGFFYHAFFKYAHDMENTVEKVEDSKLKILLLSSAPLSGFGNFKAFKTLVKENVEIFESPSIELVQKLVVHVKTLKNHSIDSLCSSNYPNLIRKIQEIVDKCIEQAREEAIRQIQFLISSQANYIFTSSAEYAELSRIDSEKPASTLKVATNGSPTPKSYKNSILNVESASEMEMKTALKAYLKKRREILENSVPPIIGYLFSDRKTLLNSVRKNLDSIRLSSNLEKLVAEPEEVHSQREKWNREIEVLNKAKEVLWGFLEGDI